MPRQWNETDKKERKEAHFRYILIDLYAYPVTGNGLLQIEFL